jgi:hypothetical protein
MNQFVVTAQHEESGATSLLSKDRYQSTGVGNVEDINSSTQSFSTGWCSDSVLTEIQLRSLLKSFSVSDGRYVVLLVTPTPGSTAIANFDATVWPRWIRSAIKKKLLEMGGVLSASPLEVTRNATGKWCVLPVKRPATNLTATPVEPVTDEDDPEPNHTS